MKENEWDQVRREAIWQYAHEDINAYEAKIICLTDGKRGSMLKRELDPLEAAASTWALSASESEIGNCKAEAERIMQAKFAGVCSVSDLIGAVTGEQTISDYDDSDIAIGKQQLAWNERQAEYEARRRAKHWTDDL